MKTEYGRWKVSGQEFRKDKRVYIPVECSCGQKRDVLRFQLTNGRSQSCGCLKSENQSKRLTTHGLSDLPEFFVWQAMIQRCHNEHHAEYENYGGRGIYVYPEWRVYFGSFIEYLGRRPSSKHSLDRIDNNSGYVPGNVRWATQKEQTRNMRRNKLITYKGITRCLADWADELKINKNTLNKRLRSGWPVEKAFETKIS